jgi:hypothetical protein
MNAIKKGKWIRRSLTLPRFGYAQEGASDLDNRIGAG